MEPEASGGLGRLLDPSLRYDGGIEGLEGPNSRRDYYSWCGLRFVLRGASFTFGLRVGPYHDIEKKNYAYEEKGLQICTTNHLIVFAMIA